MPLAVWNFITAAFVAGPKYELSMPGEPAPDEATMVAADMFKNFWSAMTLAPVEPTVMSDVNCIEHEVLLVVVVVVVVVGWPVREAWTFAIVFASAPKDWSKDTIALT
jgi:hypothetical protein